MAAFRGRAGFFDGAFAGPISGTVQTDEILQIGRFADDGDGDGQALGTGGSERRLADQFGLVEPQALFDKQSILPRVTAMP
jgi:hypothetical protein